MVYRWYVGIGQPLPRALRDVTETNYLALRDYVTKPYSGVVVLFRAENQGPLTVAATTWVGANSPLAAWRSSMCQANISRC